MAEDGGGAGAEAQAEETSATVATTPAVTSPPPPPPSAPAPATSAPATTTKKASGAASMWEQSLTIHGIISAAAVTYVTSKALWTYIRLFLRKMTNGSKSGEDVRAAEAVQKALKEVFKDACGDDEAVTKGIRVQ